MLCRPIRRHQCQNCSNADHAIPGRTIQLYNIPGSISMLQLLLISSLNKFLYFVVFCMYPVYCHEHSQIIVTWYNSNIKILSCSSKPATKFILANCCARLDVTLQKPVSIKRLRLLGAPGPAAVSNVSRMSIPLRFLHSLSCLNVHILNDSPVD